MIIIKEATLKNMTPPNYQNICKIGVLNINIPTPPTGGLKCVKNIIKNKNDDKTKPINIRLACFIVNFCLDTTQPRIAMYKRPQDITSKVFVAAINPTKPPATTLNSTLDLIFFDSANKVIDPKKAVDSIKLK